MAPRRKKKPGLTRMDAALDALRPMGYSPVLVRKCVKDLLKVYGDEGWRFIEEDAYRVLIETVLEVPETPLLENVPEKLLLEGTPDSGTNELLPSLENVPEKHLLERNPDSGTKELVPSLEQPPLEADAANSLKQLGSGPEQEQPQFGGEPFSQSVPVPQQPLVEGDLDPKLPQQPVVEGDPDPKQLVAKVEPLEELGVYGQEASAVKFHALQALDEGISIEEKKVDLVLCPTPLKTLDERITVKEEKWDAFVPSTSLKDVSARPHVGLELGFARAYNPPPDIAGKKNSNGWISDDED